MWFTILILSLIDTGGVYSDDCSDVKCSLVYDPVCGIATAADGSVATNKYHNICHLEKTQCIMSNIAEIQQTNNEDCNIATQQPRRRVADFSIVGGDQVCNHTCPTFCVDTYEPVCAKIWSPKMTVSSVKMKVMINHCHVDLFSCVTGKNVTINTIQDCYLDSTRLGFMQQVAAMRTMGLVG